MRLLKMVAVLAVFVVVGTTALLEAKQTKYGIADVRKITLASPMRVGAVLLPQGEYEVRHTMAGENHIMVFKQLHKSNPAEARVVCKLVPLKEKARQDTTIYILNSANERVLQELTFAGDSAAHVF